MGEKVEATKWVIWGIAVFLLLTLVGYALMPLSKRVEREVLVQSHQYKEGMADRVATLQAALTEIDARLMQNPDEQTKKNLIVQKSTINVQLAAARR